MSLDYFNVRSVNVVKLETVTDCEIIIAECDFAVQKIDRQIAVRSSDEDWRELALDARDELLHKKHLSQVKLASIQERIALNKNRAPVQNENSFRTRFVKAAKELLSPEKYGEISVLAGEMSLSKES